MGAVQAVASPPRQYGPHRRRRGDGLIAPSPVHASLMPTAPPDPSVTVGPFDFPHIRIMGDAGFECVMLSMSGRDAATPQSVSRTWLPEASRWTRPTPPSFTLPPTSSFCYGYRYSETGTFTEPCLESASKHHFIEGRCDGTHGRSCQARWGGFITVQRRPFIVLGDYERDRCCAEASDFERLSRRRHLACPL